jgi:hypothetical protein
MKKNLNLKLTLRKETLRTIARKDAAEVAGGISGEFGKTSEDHFCGGSLAMGTCGGCEGGSDGGDDGNTNTSVMGC